MVNDIKQLRYLFLILAFCIIIFAVCFFTSCINQTKSLGDIKEGKITKIVDGDTFYVDTFSERIRIIGVDCPEIDTAEGQKAASYTKSLLKVGQKVWLEKDTTENDKYGRPLRIVWLEKPSNTVSKDDVMNKTLEGKLLASKNAKIDTVKPNTKYAEWWSWS